jgi:Mg2+ and Co2+ transporter CorA
MIKILKCTELDSNIREVDLIDKGCWIDMSNPTKQEIEFVVKATRCG